MTYSLLIKWIPDGVKNGKVQNVDLTYSYGGSDN